MDTSSLLERIRCLERENKDLRLAQQEIQKDGERLSENSSSARRVRKSTTNIQSAVVFDGYRTRVAPTNRQTDPGPELRALAAANRRKSGKQRSLGASYDSLLLSDDSTDAELVDFVDNRFGGGGDSIGNDDDDCSSGSDSPKPKEPPPDVIPSDQSSDAELEAYVERHFGGGGDNSLIDENENQEGRSVNGRSADATLDAGCAVDNPARRPSHRPSCLKTSNKFKARSDGAIKRRFSSQRAGLTKGVSFSNRGQGMKNGQTQFSFPKEHDGGGHDKQGDLNVKGESAEKGPLSASGSEEPMPRRVPARKRHTLAGSNISTMSNDALHEILSNGLNFSDGKKGGTTEEEKSAPLRRCGRRWSVSSASNVEEMNNSFGALSSPCDLAEDRVHFVLSQNMKNRYAKHCMDEMTKVLSSNKWLGLASHEDRWIDSYGNGAFSNSQASTSSFDGPTLKSEDIAEKSAPEDKGKEFDRRKSWGDKSLSEGIVRPGGKVDFRSSAGDLLRNQSKSSHFQCRHHKLASFVELNLLNMALSIDADSQRTGVLEEKGLEEYKPETRLAFRQFMLLSINPASAPHVISKGSCKNCWYLHPFTMQWADCVDRYPPVHDRQRFDHDLEPKSLSTFCFPEGITARLIPRSGLVGARRLGWIGKNADKYRLLAFTNGAGVTWHGIAITIREEMSTQNPGTGVLVKRLSAVRKERLSAQTIVRWWRDRLEKKLPTERAPGASKNEVPAPVRVVSEAPVVTENQHIGAKGKSVLKRSLTFIRKRSGLNADGGRRLETQRSYPFTYSKAKDPKTKPSSLIARNKKKKSKKKGGLKSEGYIPVDDVPNRSKKSFPKKIKLWKRKKKSKSKNEPVAHESPQREGADAFQDESIHSSNGSIFDDSSAGSFLDDLSGNEACNIDNTISVMDKEGGDGMNSCQNVSDKLSELGKEAYQAMCEDSMLGEVCVVEKCYTLIGGRQAEQFLQLHSLQHMIDLEREERALHTRSGNAFTPFRTKDSPRSRMAMSPLDIVPGVDALYNPTLSTEETRHEFLGVIQKHMCLTSDQARIQFPKSDLDVMEPSEIFEIKCPALRGTFEMRIPLPLPQAADDWGLAAALMRMDSDSLFVVLKLLLIERSVLVLGESPDIVTACACALLELIKPFRWASTFIPLLPENMLDFVNSPVPFVSGMIIESLSHGKLIENDERVKDAISEGLSVMNLSSGLVTITTEAGVASMLHKCPAPKLQLHMYQRRLKLLCIEGSSLESFGRFVRVGLSPKETVTLKATRRLIGSHMKTLAGDFASIDGWQKYGEFDDADKSFDFYPSLFIDPLREQLESQLQLQEMITHSQMFIEFVNEQRQSYVARHEMAKGKIGRFIANWVYHWWKFKKRKNNVSASLDEHFPTAFATAGFSSGLTVAGMAPRKPSRNDCAEMEETEARTQRTDDGNNARIPSFSAVFAV